MEDCDLLELYLIFQNCVLCRSGTYGSNANAIIALLYLFVYYFNLFHTSVLKLGHRTTILLQLPTL